MGEAKMHISPDTIIDGKMIKDMTIEEKNYLIATYKAKRNIELIIDENKEK